MKKFAILLLATVAFCKELSVTDLTGNEIKFELKDNALFENGKKIEKNYEQYQSKNCSSQH